MDRIKVAIDIVFDDRKMAMKMLIIVVAIAILITYSHLVGNHKELSIRECLEAPEKYDGTLLVIKKETKIGNIYEDGFEIVQPYDNVTIFVSGDTTGLIKNAYVTLTATFHKEGYLELHSIHVHKRRRVKFIASIVTVIIVFANFVRWFKFDVHRKRFVERCQTY